MHETTLGISIHDVECMLMCQLGASGLIESPNLKYGITT